MYTVVQAITADGEGAIFAVLIAIVSLFLLYQGLSTLRTYRAVSRQRPVAVRDALAEADPVELEGTVRPADKQLESPLFGRPCAAYEYEVEERRPNRGRRSGRSWRTIESKSERRPFVLEDDSGRAYVDPTDATLELDSERTRRPPGGAGERGWFAKLQPTIQLGPFTMGNARRYTESSLAIGETVYVHGSAGRAPTDTDAAVAVSGTDCKTFLVSDATEAVTRRRLRRRGAGYALGGLCGAALALAIAAGVL